MTGSSDGYVRAVQILPTKLLGVVADHGEWPIERIAVGGGHHQVTIDDGDSASGTSRVSGKLPETDSPADDAVRRWWVGSVGHEDVLRLTDLEGFFRDNQGNEDENKGALGVDVSEDDSDIEEDADADDDAVTDDKATATSKGAAAEADQDDESGSDSEADSDDSDGEPEPQHLKRKAKKPLAIASVKRQKAGRNTVATDPSFFDDL